MSGLTNLLSSFFNQCDIEEFEYALEQPEIIRFSVLTIKGLSLKMSLNSSISWFDNSLKWGTKLKRPVNQYLQGVFIYIQEWNIERYAPGGLN